MAEGDEAEDPKGANQLPIALFAFILLLVLADLGDDVRNGIDRAHMASEVVAAGLALWGVAALGLRLRRERQKSGTLAADLAHAREEARRFSQESRETLDTLSGAVATQFERWGLTEAERDIAFLLLKGLRLKEIAGARNTSERTVRQQALAIYRKAGVEGRTELAGFFLEGLHMSAPRGRPS